MKTVFLIVTITQRGIVGWLLNCGPQTKRKKGTTNCLWYDPKTGRGAFQKTTKYLNHDRRFRNESRTWNVPSINQKFYPSNKTFESIDIYRYFSADTDLSRSHCHPVPYSTLISDLKHQDKLDKISSCTHFTHNLVVLTSHRLKWLENLATKLEQQEINSNLTKHH